tara:strand:+ start:406 stop:624 length:219 start_codon:yes stop_codon:yes gene_type:complete
MKCSICKGEIEPLLHPVNGKVVWSKGNNAEPINKGRCCDGCNLGIVVPSRLNQINNERVHFVKPGVSKEDFK